VPGVDPPLAIIGATRPLVAGLFAYGPVPGLELIPYFLGLLAWLGMAVVAVAWSPLAALWRRVRGKRGPSAAARQPEAIGTQTPPDEAD
jgi:hypothetical protein